MNSYEVAFDGADYCAVIRYEVNLGESYLRERQFNPKDLRGNWKWFRNQIPYNQDFSNIGVIHCIGVHRSKQTRGYGRRALKLAHYLMQKSGVFTGFLEADPHMMICEEGFYEQYVKERVDFYSSEGWQLLDSEVPNPPRPHMWLNFERIVTARPQSIVYREVDDDEFEKHWNLSDQEGHRAGTEQV